MAQQVQKRLDGMACYEVIKVNGREVWRYLLGYRVDSPLTRLLTLQEAVAELAPGHAEAPPPEAA